MGLKTNLTSKKILNKDLKESLEITPSKGIKTIMDLPLNILRKFTSDKPFISIDEDYKYEYIGTFKNGLAKFRTNTWLTGFIDVNGDEKFKERRNFLGEFSEGLVVYSNYDRPSKWGLMDTNGNKLYEGKYSYLSEYGYKNGFLNVGTTEKEQFLTFYIDISGNELLKGKYKRTGDFKNGYAEVTTHEGETVYIDTAFNEIKELPVEAIDKSFKSYLDIPSGKECFKDYTGKQILLGKYYEIYSDFIEGYAAVKTKKYTTGFTDIKGNFYSDAILNTNLVVNIDCLIEQLRKTEKYQEMKFNLKPFIQNVFKGDYNKFQDLMKLHGVENEELITLYTQNLQENNIHITPDELETEISFFKN